MFALQLGTTIFWISVCLVAALSLLALVVGIARALGAHPSRRLLTRLALGVGTAAVLAPIAGVVVYTQFINDPAPEFDNDDLANLVGAGDSSSTTGALALGFGSALSGSADPETAPTEPSTSEAGIADCAITPSGSEPVTTEAASDGTVDPDSLDGEWTIAEGSEFGYRIPETLAGVDTEATGRGSEIAGSFTAAGTEVTEACFVVQVASITSDESMRDGQFNSRIMETEEFPTATFVLTETIVLDGLPEVGGDPITAEASGELTLHGVTQPVTFEVTVQAGDGEGNGAVVGVLGQIPVTFSDYEIDDPSGGPAQVGDEGTLEFLLAFQRS